MKIMKKFIIVGVFVVVVGILVIWFLMQNRESFNAQITEIGDNLNIAATTETKNITNINDEKITKKMTNATLNTNMGSITIEFFEEQAPKTVANFSKLVGEGFYNGVKFHRVIKGFMIQTGDPLTKDDFKMENWGRGGPGYQFADEIGLKSDLYTKTGYRKGIVAMANSGPDTNGSQFFIMTETYPLSPQYTIFGKVVSGQDVVDKIANVPTTAGDRPVKAVVINNMTLK